MSEILNKIDVNDYSIQKIKSQGGGQANLQSKDVTITENGTTTVTADVGYDGLSDVDVTVNVSSGSSIPDWSQIGYSGVPSSLLDMFEYSKEIYNNWDSKQRSLESKYAGNENIRYMPLVNTSRATSAGNMFRSASNLIEVPELNLSNVTTAYQMFYNAGALIKVAFLNLGKVTDMQDMFAYCPHLNEESLNNILATCIGATSYTGTKTLAKLGLSSSQATTCQSLSNWDAFVSAGWTSGY